MYPSSAGATGSASHDTTNAALHSSSPHHPCPPDADPPAASRTVQRAFRQPLIKPHEGLFAAVANLKIGPPTAVRLHHYRRQTIYAAAIGYDDAAARRPVLPETTFQIGSIGKSMTALAVMQLAEAGRLDLNAPVATHLPWLVIPSPYGAIALRHLLSHTAGLPAGRDFTPAARYEAYALRHARAAWEPGRRFHYSNTGYKILGWLLEDVTGQDYAAILQRRVLDPIGMTATDAVIAHRARHRMAAGHIALHDDRPYRRGDPLIPAPWMEYAAGDGSPATTAGDLARYARLWLNGGRVDDSKINAGRALISPASYRMMIAPAIRMARGDRYQHDYGYGYGIISHYADGHHFIGHGGSTVGFRAIMLADLTDGLAVVILVNGGDVDTYAPARYALQYAAAIRSDSPLPEPPPLPDPTRLADADRYAGDYTDPATGAALSVQTDGDGRLRLRDKGAAGIILEHIDGNTFVAPDDAFDPYPLRFRFPAPAPDGGIDGMAAAVCHGAAVYIRDGDSDAAGALSDAAAPPQSPPGWWTALPGHYRSHAPYISNFRIILRRRQLCLAWPHGGEELLTPEPAGGDDNPGAGASESGWFAVGPAGEPTAERLRFDPIVSNRALRVRWAGTWRWTLTGCRCGCWSRRDDDGLYPGGGSD